MSEITRLKIRIIDEYHDRSVQKALAELGLRWYSREAFWQADEGGNHSLYVDTTDKYLSMMPRQDPQSESFFVNDDRQEMFLHSDGKLYGSPEVKHVERGPLGLKPRKLHDEQRLQELLAAMTRFTEAGKEIPEAWIVELFTVNKGAQTPIISS